MGGDRLLIVTFDIMVIIIITIRRIRPCLSEKSLVAHHVHRQIPRGCLLLREPSKLLLIVLHRVLLLRLLHHGLVLIWLSGWHVLLWSLHVAAKLLLLLLASIPLLLLVVPVVVAPWYKL